MSDQVDAAIATSQMPEARVSGELALSTGRVVRLEMPVGLGPGEVVELMIAIPNIVGQVNTAAASAAGRIALPDGGLRLVERSA